MSNFRRLVRNVRKMNEVGHANPASMADEIARLRIALADAIRRPLGVIPDSAVGLVSDADLDAAEARRIQNDP